MPFLLLTILFTAANWIWWKERYSKRGVVKQYRKLLARTLVVRNGYAPAYRATDVTRALFASHVSMRFASYAYAMFCDATEFSKAPLCGGLDYQAMRQELESFAPKKTQ